MGLSHLTDRLGGYVWAVWLQLKFLGFGITCGLDSPDHVATPGAPKLFLPAPALCFRRRRKEAVHVQQKVKQAPTSWVFNVEGNRYGGKRLQDVGRIDRIRSSAQISARPGDARPGNNADSRQESIRQVDWVTGPYAGNSCLNLETLLPYIVPFDYSLKSKPSARHMSRRIVHTPHQHYYMKLKV